LIFCFNFEFRVLIFPLDKSQRALWHRVRWFSVLIFRFQVFSWTRPDFGPFGTECCNFGFSGFILSFEFWVLIFCFDFWFLIFRFWFSGFDFLF
jgi:hypothetical protein